MKNTYYLFLISGKDYGGERNRSHRNKIIKKLNALNASCHWFWKSRLRYPLYLREKLKNKVYVRPFEKWNREERDYSQVYELHLLKACKLKTGEKDIRGKAASDFFPRTSLPIKLWPYRRRHSGEKARPKEASSTEKLLLRRSAGNKSLNHFYPGNFPSRRELFF